MAMKTVIANPATKVGVAAWTAEDQAELDRVKARQRELEQRAAEETKLEPTSIEVVQQLVMKAYTQERASIIAFFPRMAGGGRAVMMQVEDDLNFALKTRKPQRFALFRVTEGTKKADGSKSNPFRIGAAFIINLFGRLETKEFRQEVEPAKPEATKPV